MSSCGWALPGDVVISLSQKTMSLLDDVPISFAGDLSAGDCSIRVDGMHERFVGDWSCFFNVGDNTVWTSPAHLEIASAQARTGEETLWRRAAGDVVCAREHDRGMVVR